MLDLPRSAPLKRSLTLGAALLLFLAIPVVLVDRLPTAAASHNRGTQLTWTSTATPGEAVFQISFSARRSFYSNAEPGQVINDPVLDFGDGTSTAPDLQVVAVDPDADILFAEGTITHQYDPGVLLPFTASLSGCCRISASSGHINNADGSFRVETLVNFAADRSPTSSISPIVECPIEATCSFPVPASASNSYIRSWRLATADEASGSAGGFIEPGPPYSDTAASVDAFSGNVVWDTAGVQLSTSSEETYYSVQVIIEYSDPDSLALLSSTATDFLIRLGSSASAIPNCTDTDGNGVLDNDGDGLCDNWETEGIDGNGDGEVDLRLYDDNGDGQIAAGEGADPNRRDIYVEIDQMSGLRPDENVLAQVRQAFANAPDGGMRLHLIVDETLTLSDSTAFASCENIACPPGVTGFDDLKERAFGRAGERVANNAAAILNARRFAFHYSLFANQLYDHVDRTVLPGVRGIAEIIGNDTMILPTQMQGTRRVPQIATTFMHELGHNLGLTHGGGLTDTTNCKPNYLSIMNYTFSEVGYVPARPMDFSHGGQQLLDETSLSENDGVFGPYNGFTVTAYGDSGGDYRRADLGGPIDWNDSGGFFPIDDGRVAADINLLPGRSDSCSGAGSTLEPHNDWANLEFVFYSDAEFAFDVHFTPPDYDGAITTEAYREASRDEDSDGLLDVDDNCATVTNADQADQDGDGFGDLCDEDAPPPAPACTITGTDGSNFLIGTPGRDVICGLGGADFIMSLGGDDLIQGGPGNDLISGGAGNDTVDGGDGRNSLRGEDGEDILIGGPSDDVVRGDSGNDRLDGGTGGRNVLDGGAGTDNCVNATVTQRCESS